MGAIEMKWGKVLPVACMMALGVGVLLINLFWVPDFDALAYAFGGMNITEQSIRIASLGDIVRQQMTDYVKIPGNGRVFVHGLCAFFMGFKLYTLFKLLNTAMWCLFTWLVLRTGGLTREKTSLWGWAFGSAVVWWVCWYGSTAINAAFALNYLWTAVATLILFALWKRLKWWMLPFAFLYGWSQECFVLPALAALGGSMVVRSIVERRRAFTWQQALAWLLILAGACFLCLAPAALVRAEHGIPTSVIGVLRAGEKLLLLSPIPFVCMANVLWRKWRGRTSFGAFCASFLPSLEWWIYFVAGVCLMLTYVAVRTGMPAFMALIVLLVRERRWLRIPCWLKSGWVLFVLLWAGATTYFQYRTGQNVRECLARYCADPQGITYLPRVNAGPLKQSFWSALYNYSGSVAFKFELGHKEMMVTFAPWLYHALYLEPQKFFSEAEPVPGTPCYFSTKAPRVLVAKGDVIPSEAECARMADRFRAYGSTIVLPKYIPGRFFAMFPKTDDALQSFPKPRFVFVAKDGKMYTVFADGPDMWGKARVGRELWDWRGKIGSVD